MEMNELFESMDIEQEQKVALQESFDKAVLKKTTEMLDEHVEAQVAEKVELLEAEFAEKSEFLAESIDGYLDTVVEEFKEANAPMYEAQIQDAKAATLLEMFDKMMKVAGVDMLSIQEAKDESSIELQLEEKEEKISALAEKLVEAKREADKYLKAGVIAEVAKDLTVLESAKFEKLADMVPFSREASYLENLETIKESIIDNRAEDFEASVELPSGAFKPEAKPDTKMAMSFEKYI